jgi:hypothetical protein
MKPLRSSLIASICLLLSACNMCTTGTGETQPEERLVANFSEITLDCSADIVIRERKISDKNMVVVEAQPNILPLIVTKVTGNTLNIDMEGCVSHSKAITIYIYVDDISEVTNNGSGSISSSNILKADQFEINQSGSGNIDLKIRANRIDAHHESSGDIMLSGNSNKIEIALDGSGSCNTLALNSDVAEVNLNGSGTVSVFATRQMDLHLDGSGSIFYAGKPEKLNTSDNGSGEIREAE